MIDLSVVTKSLDTFQEDLAALQSLVTNDLDSNNLAKLLLERPKLYSVLCAFLSISAAVELEDGQILPSPVAPPRNLDGAIAASKILLELGLNIILNRGADVTSLFLLVQISADAPRRKSRLEARVKTRIQDAVEIAVATASLKTGKSYSIGSKSLLPIGDRAIIDFVVAIDNKPVFAIATTYQAYSGGRQTREIRVLYPAVCSKLASAGISMILIADGIGMRGYSDRILLELFTNIPHTMSIIQAENGALVSALQDFPLVPAPLVFDAAGLNKLIDNALASTGSIDAVALPVPHEAARLALANYASANTHLNLNLADGGVGIVWANSNLVTQFKDLQINFDGNRALSALARLLSIEEDAGSGSTSGASSIVATLPNDQVFTSKFLISARDGRADPELLREIARHALQSAPESRVAVLMISTPVGGALVQQLKDIQSLLPVTVVVVDLNTCVEWAQSKGSPRDGLKNLLLEQTDLTKLSPFVVRGVTPARVFFGREQEEATLLSTLSTNSVALLGGRRIGKTSLMRHSFARLLNANFRPYFGDCQVVRTWADFGLMASRNWAVTLPSDFKPQHLFDLVKQLSIDSDRPTVILLDEIDQLLDWDKNHTDNEVPEAFFRACRSISQQGLAQFVFSGERTIANRLWDASSPHWNFCRPLMLQQLSVGSARSLIAEPLEAIGIRINHRDEFLLSCWECTDGHPELLQFLGDKVVTIVNNRERADVFCSPDDVTQLIEQFEYAEQYLETYWGQASALERIVSILLIEGAKTVEDLLASLYALSDKFHGADLQGALRMLELYGITQQCPGGYELRARWFTTALSFYGGKDVSIKRYVGEFSI